MQRVILDRHHEILDECRFFCPIFGWSDGNRMLLHTQGIVFRAIKYGESSIITDIFTREKGLLSYIIGGVRKKNSKVSPGLFQVMTVLDLVVYHSDSQKLHRIREVKPALLFQSIPFDVAKSSIILFMAELCSKTIQEPEANPGLYEFIVHTLKELDEKRTHFQNDHLHFMVGLAAQLGFALQPRQSAGDAYFDLREGQFASVAPEHMEHVSPPLSGLLADLVWHQQSGGHVPMDRASRRALLSDLILYFRLHTDQMKDLKSYHILTEVL